MKNYSLTHFSNHFEVKAFGLVRGRVWNREEKSLRHVAMVAKFNPKGPYPLKFRKKRKRKFLCCVHLLHEAGA